MADDPRAVIRRYLESNDESRTRLRTVVERISDEELARPLGGGWTVAAALLHVAFWDRRAVALLDRWEREGLTPDRLGNNVDAVNDALLHQALLVPPRAAAHEALAAAEAVDGTLAALTPQMVETILAAGEPVPLDRGRHRRAHLDEIERVLGGAGR